MVSYFHFWRYALHLVPHWSRGFLTILFQTSFVQTQFQMLCLKRWTLRSINWIYIYFKLLVLIMRIINTCLLVLLRGIGLAESGPKISTMVLSGILALLFAYKLELAWWAYILAICRILRVGRSPWRTSHALQLPLSIHHLWQLQLQILLERVEANLIWEEVGPQCLGNRTPVMMNLMNWIRPWLPYLWMVPVLQQFQRGPAGYQRKKAIKMLWGMNSFAMYGWIARSSYNIYQVYMYNVSFFFSSFFSFFSVEF